MIVDSCSKGYGNKLLDDISSLINKNKQCIIPNNYSQGKIKIYMDNMIAGQPIKDDGEEELDQIVELVV